ncbi:hypothetical protein AYO44_17490 [Planctomycetaceae bacterium SCGC AG-212-F19]|nr:hypothetical protein AYO44_17490 [Planctomycetaceae bacterium SCGC AG-212-F19]
MLVLSRKNLESVVVGGSAGFERMLKVTVLEIANGKVKLGFEVDTDVPVHRLEVWEKMQAGEPQRHPSGTRAPPAENGNGHKPQLSELEPSRTMGSSIRAAGVPRKYGILIADDDPTIREVLHVSMQQQGFVVWLAADGQEALDLYQRHCASIHVVLLDVTMPGQDGPETLTALRKINPAVNCCFMTGDVGSYAEARLGLLSASALIRKPFHPAEVAQMLWELAGHPERRPASV